MTDAFVSINDDGLAAKHGQHIAFRANHGAGRAADALVRVNVRVLRLRAFRKELPLLRRFAGLGRDFLLLPEIIQQEEKNDACGNQECKGIVHGVKGALDSSRSSWK